MIEVEKRQKEAKGKSSAGIYDELVYASFIWQGAHNDSLALLVPVISRPFLSLRFSSLYFCFDVVLLSVLPMMVSVLWYGTSVCVHVRVF